ncbi:DUF3896 family protein [Anaerobacillus sp. MEB173]|uniref:DUF3896 family protein n=1 Tax=Anaerobacillus sp. MEB173 TaxID=3383345 RepID=UPI003F938F2D
MDYREVMETLEAVKYSLMAELKNPDLSMEEKENIKKTIENYDYIIELTEMNHFERGHVVH